MKKNQDIVSLRRNLGSDLMNDQSDSVLLFTRLAIAAALALGFVIGILVQRAQDIREASYCSTCNKIYFDESNRCDECGTEYIKNKP